MHRRHELRRSIGDDAVETAIGRGEKGTIRKQGQSVLPAIDAAESEALEGLSEIARDGNAAIGSDVDRAGGSRDEREHSARRSTRGARPFQAIVARAVDPIVDGNGEEESPGTF